MSDADTIHALLRRGADDAVAIAGEGRAPLRFRDLRRLLESTVDRLNAVGVGRGDRVAIVLPNGPEMASAFLAIAAGATTAPLNPAYGDQEFAFYFDDLAPKALVVAAGAEGPALGAAAARGVPVLRLLADPATAGAFTLEGGRGAAAARPGLAEAGDAALVLHTSGTTSRPKLVPLTHRNLTRSASHIAQTLGLAPADRCLNIMPLFHIHGLMAATLASLGAGASVWCSAGFNALRFFAELTASGATWYTAVPTMHQAILARAARNAEAIRAARLRFIRSSSASLPPPVMAALEETFGVPVIESYGMTEAAHQMASNPLPPRARKPGSVGLAAGPAVAIADAEGRFLDPGARGEIVIRGENVTTGYEANPAANASAFFDGWFRTGDEGYLDADGYLFLTGRLKEMINRGGEKVSPREVDDVLMEHPAVAQVVTFALPHPKLGEEVAAAVVLKEGASADERALRDFVAARLADFKVPRKVVFLAEIPKGPTGKLQRIGLAQRLGLEG